MVSLYDFQKELLGDIDNFVKYWEKRHQEAPDLYPMEIKEDNSGLWFEMFMEINLSAKSLGE
jgi:hypothetical protein